jgi:ubiquinone biosynthesis protein
VAVFAKNGFQNVAEKIRLGRFLLERFSKPGIDTFTPAERMRMAFEELGPTFVKLGQVLATRPDLVPVEFVEEFKKLHDQVAAVPFSEIKAVLEENFEEPIDQVFREIEVMPLAAASIAQVHRAVLITGEEVVVKVQRPGIADIIKNDINVLYYLAELLQKYVPEVRPFNPIGIVDEFFKSLELETNFIIEANNIRRFQENFKNDPTVKIPDVYFDYSGHRVLVLEALQGIPLSQRASLDQEGVEREKVMDAGLRCYFKMVFKDGFFHGDLHAGNIFILPDNRIGLIDFGIVGRLNRRVQDAIANMFVSLYTEDYERLAYEYVELAPYSDAVDVDQFAKDLQDLLAPYFGLSMKNVDLGRLMMDSTGVAARHRLILPSELMLFFKSIVTVEGMAHMIVRDFNLLDHALEFAEELVKAKYSPDRVGEDVLLFGRDATALLSGLPRQLKQFVRKVNHPDFAFSLSLVELEELKRSIETSSNILFLGLIIGSLIVSASGALFLSRGPVVFDMPVVSAAGYGLAIVLGMVAFYNYIRK